MKTKLFAGLVTVLALISPTTSTLADSAYPTKPIKIIVPYTPGDAADVIARLIGAKISKSLGQPVVVENKAGASGQIGINLAAKAAPDGYTLGVGQVTNLALAPNVFKSLPYNPLKDFAPVALVSTNYLVLAAGLNAPFKTMAEMIQWAKENPGKLTIGTSSVGGLPDMSFRLLAHITGFTFRNIPYKGSAPIVTDLMGGRVDMGVAAYTSFAAALGDPPHIRLLGITNPTRDPNLPKLPTVGETVKGYSSTGWFGFVAPAGTPVAIVNKLNSEINQAIGSPQIEKAMSTLGLIPANESPEYFAKLIKSEDEKFGKLVKDVGYQPQ